MIKKCVDLKVKMLKLWISLEIRISVGFLRMTFGRGRHTFFVKMVVFWGKSGKMRMTNVINTVVDRARHRALRLQIHGHYSGYYVLTKSAIGH